MATKPKINQKISKVNRTVYSDRNIKYLVIHYVGAVSTAKNNATFFYSTWRGASAHYFVDDTSIWQAVLDKNAAWQCGGGSQGSGGKKYFGKCNNSNSIGIEMCCKRDKNGKLYISDKTIARTAQLVQYLQDKYNIPDSHVIRHYDVTGKNCPAPYVNEAKWKTLKATLINKPLAPTVVYPTVDLQKGDTGTQVVRLQKCLNKIMGYKLEVDGSFGAKTLTAVKKFQKKYGLVVDGSVGPKTRAKIKALM